jgi:hypothetical protein
MTAQGCKLSGAKSGSLAEWDWLTRNTRLRLRPLSMTYFAFHSYLKCARKLFGQHQERQLNVPRPQLILGVERATLDWMPAAKFSKPMRVFYAPLRPGLRISFRERDDVCLFSRN